MAGGGWYNFPVRAFGIDLPANAIHSLSKGHRMTPIKVPHDSKLRLLSYTDESGAPRLGFARAGRACRGRGESR